MGTGLPTAHRFVGGWVGECRARCSRGGGGGEECLWKGTEKGAWSPTWPADWKGFSLAFGVLQSGTACTILAATKTLLV